MSPESIVVVLPANLTWLSPVLAHLTNQRSRDPLVTASRLVVRRLLVCTRLSPGPRNDIILCMVAPQPRFEPATTLLAGPTTIARTQLRRRRVRHPNGPTRASPSRPANRRLSPSRHHGCQRIGRLPPNVQTGAWTSNAATHDIH
jgi:hypothetical protein